MSAALLLATGLLLPAGAPPGYVQFEDPSAVPVERDALLPGDLVFFGTDAKSITHAGLYLGDRRFISATTHETPVVREDRLDDPHWFSIYQGARPPR